MSTLLRFSLILVVFLCFASFPCALPMSYEPRDTIRDVGRAGIIVNDADGNLVIFNSQTNQVITQGVASDGGGSGFDAAALVWIVLLYVTGVPLAIAGVRGWRLTLGAAIGLVTGVSAWAAFINTVSNVGIPDIALTGIVLGFMVVGFTIGLFEFGRIAGIAALGSVGGLALGMRVVLFQNNLLVSLFVINWVIVALCGMSGLVLVLWNERIGVILWTASIGTFLISLGVDLTVNKQTGMSRGLRFFCDRNASHLADILSNGYIPPLSTKIILAGSLVAIPLLAFMQHKFFRDPFDRRPPEELDIDFDPTSVDAARDKLDVGSNPTTIAGPGVPLKSRFSQFSTV